MKKLNRKLILEILNEDDSSQKEIEEQPIEEPIKVEEPVELDKGEKINFIVSILTDLSQRVLDLFNYLTPIINNELDKDILSEQNKNLLNSIYEDISLVLGKIQQGTKDNCVDTIQNAIDDGQTQAQETISTPDQLEESLKTDKEKLWSDLINNIDIGDDVDEVSGEVEYNLRQDFFENPKTELEMWKEYYKENPEMLDKIKAFEDKYKEKLEESMLKEAPDEYGLPTDDELNSEADRIRKEYDQKIKDLYSNRDSKREEIKLREFREVLNKLNSNPALEKLKNQITNNEILKFNITDDKSSLTVSCFGKVIIFGSTLPEFKYIGIRLNLSNFTFGNDYYVNKLDSQIKLMNLINDNLEYIIDLNKEKNEGEFEYNLTGSLGNTLKRAIGEKDFSKISKITDVSNGSHWAWGDKFMLFEYEGNLYHFEAYNDQVNININERTKGLRFVLFNKVKNDLGWYENPIIEKLGIEGFKTLFPEAQIFQDYIIC